jgi:hypothetical protein
MNEFNRRSSDREEDTHLKKDMLDALASIEDPGQRIVLMLLLRSMDNISSKLDRVLSDEAKIKHIVLNGHAEKHDEHHKFLEDQILKSQSVVNAVTFVKKREELGGYCDYAAKMLITEENLKKQRLESEKVIKESRRKVLENITEKILWAVIIFLVGSTIGSNFFKLL